MKKGFSLVELSIVLVILGLLVGGVLSGQSLIRAAELRTIPVQYAKILSSVNQFKDKYFALPGDMTNATDFWGTALSGNACRFATGTGTCNGNGNGKINDGIWITNLNSNESFRFWQHLANAGLISGQYTGVSGAANSRTSTLSNSYLGKLSASLWFVWDWKSYAGLDSHWYGLDYNNILVFGRGNGVNWPYFSILKPSELWNIDKKIDDGKPASGNIISMLINRCTTSTDRNDLSGEYTLSSDTIECSMIFRNAF